jgi:FkbM family methyltransferase
MSLRVDRPYFVNWLHWNLYYRLFAKNGRHHASAWEFIRRIRSMKPGSLVIDGGANVGRVTHAFRRCGFEVHAFEPDPYAAEIFARRFAGDTMVHLHPAAVGARADRLKLHRTTKFARKPRRATISSSLVHRPIHGDDFSVDVDVVDLIAFIGGLGRHVDILKLDVEGAEVGIIERILDEGIHRDIGAIYVETHERFSPEIAERTQRLRDRIAAEGITNIDLDWI